MPAVWVSSWVFFGIGTPLSWLEVKSPSHLAERETSEDKSSCVSAPRLCPLKDSLHTDSGFVIEARLQTHKFSPTWNTFIMIFYTITFMCKLFQQKEKRQAMSSILVSSCIYLSLVWCTVCISKPEILPIKFPITLLVRLFVFSHAIDLAPVQIKDIQGPQRMIVIFLIHFYINKYIYFRLKNICWPEMFKYP